MAERDVDAQGRPLGMQPDEELWSDALHGEGLIDFETELSPESMLQHDTQTPVPTPEDVQRNATGWRQVLNRFVADQDTPLMLMTMASVLGSAPRPGTGRVGHISEAVRQGMLARNDQRAGRQTARDKQAYNLYLQDTLKHKRDVLEFNKTKPKARDPASDAAAVLDAKYNKYIELTQKAFPNMAPDKVKQFAVAAVAPAKTEAEADDAFDAALRKLAAEGAAVNPMNPLAPPDPEKVVQAADEMERTSKSMRRAVEASAKLKKMGYEVIATDYKAQTITFKKPDGTTLTKSYAEAPATEPALAPPVQ